MNLPFVENLLQHCHAYVRIYVCVWNLVRCICIYRTANNTKHTKKSGRYAPHIATEKQKHKQGNSNKTETERTQHDSKQINGAQFNTRIDLLRTDTRTKTNREDA